eukprot:scaffold81077_cov75-Phaeocystis_antarctica.AAC.2
MGVAQPTARRRPHPAQGRVEGVVTAPAGQRGASSTHDNHVPTLATQVQDPTDEGQPCVGRRHGPALFWVQKLAQARGEVTARAPCSPRESLPPLGASLAPLGASRAPLWPLCQPGSFGAPGSSAAHSHRSGQLLTAHCSLPTAHCLLRHFSVVSLPGRGTTDVEGAPDPRCMP